jgi:hypothetical protein
MFLHFSLWTPRVSPIPALGDLPWISHSAGNNEKVVLCMKTLITAEELCEGLPTPFCKFVTYVRSLGFDEKPDY